MCFVVGVVLWLCFAPANKQLIAQADRLDVQWKVVPSLATETAVHRGTNVKMGKKTGVSRLNSKIRHPLDLTAAPLSFLPRFFFVLCFWLFSLLSRPLRRPAVALV